MKILIVKLSSLGDVIHTLPAVSFIKKSLPEAQIEWLCYKNYSAILQDLESINKVIELPSKSLNDFLKVSQQIKGCKYDYVIDFQGLIKTGVLSFFSGAKVFGFQYPREKLAALLYSEKLKSPPTLENKEHIVLQNLILAEFFVEKISGKKIKIDEVEFFGDVQNIFLPNAVDGTLRTASYSKVCIIPSTTWESKLWPAQYWIELINFLHSNFNSEIYILGTMADMPNIEPIISQLRVPFHLVTNKKLTDLREFFAEMDLVVGVDTGPLHIAAAVLYPFKNCKKIIGIYGPTSASRSGPFGFESLSFDEIFQQVASNKKTFVQDGFSMAKLKAEYLIKKL